MAFLWQYWIYLLTAIVAGYLLFDWLRTPVQIGQDSGCGKCGYSVRGATHFSCPECGSDLREVGITRPNSSRERKKIAFFVVSVMPVALIISRLIIYAIRAF